MPQLLRVLTVTHHHLPLSLGVPQTLSSYSEVREGGLNLWEPGHLVFLMQIFNNFFIYNFINLNTPIFHAIQWNLIWL